MEVNVTIIVGIVLVVHAVPNVEVIGYSSVPQGGDLRSSKLRGLTIGTESRYKIMENVV